MRLHRRATTIAYDPFLGDEQVREAARFLEAGDWIPTLALLRDVEDRSLYMNMLTSLAVDLGAFHTWVDADPCGLSMTMLAMRQMTEAWAIGRMKPGERTQQEIDDEFRAQLRIADRTIADACSRHPDLVDAWAASIPIATGLGFGPSAAVRRFARAQSLHLYHRNATISMLRAKFARWGGTDRSMLEFARYVSFHTAPDSQVQSALPIAHLEYAAAHGDRARHFSTIENRDELKYVVIHFLDAMPSGRAPIEHLEALNTFVAALGSVRPVEYELVDECIVRIADRPTAMPWRRGGADPAEAYHSFIANLF